MKNVQPYSAEDVGDRRSAEMIKLYNSNFVQNDQNILSNLKDKHSRQLFKRSSNNFNFMFKVEAYHSFLSHK